MPTFDTLIVDRSSLKKNKAFIQLLEYLEEIFPGWVKAPPTGILGSFFDDSLKKFSEEGYLEMNTTSVPIGTGKSRKFIDEHRFRISAKGFRELDDYRNKKWHIIPVVISIIALVISAVSFILNYFL